ncbi:MAG: hypothetical protein V7635_489 [Arthrobacter sp.]
MTGTPALQPGRRPGHGRGDPGGAHPRTSAARASPPEGQGDVGPFVERIQDVVNAPDGPDWQLDTLSLKAPPRPPGPEMPLRALRGGT